MSQDSLRPIHLTAQHSSDVAKVNSHLAASRKRFRFWSTNKREDHTRRDKLPPPVWLDSESESEDEQRLRDRIVTQFKRISAPGADGARETVECPPILLVDERADTIDGTKGQDLYQWAVLYENQRGITLFGMAWYSSRGLLPGDPPAFTIPLEYGNTDPKSMFTPHTLRDFQLPDATWLWVSRSWLVQMAGNGGSHDGFEYNWCFRKKGWRSFPGFLNTGGWVRRRKWVRLMMRPADLPLGDDSTPGGVQNPGDDQNPVWQGNAQDDWARCRQKLHRIGTDGGKIALWRAWFANSISLADSKKPDTLTTLNESDLPKALEFHVLQDTEKGVLCNTPFERSEHLQQQFLDEHSDLITPFDMSQEHGLVQRAWIVSVLNAYTTDILLSFMYPSSRVIFVRMLTTNGVDVQNYCDALAADFWSAKETFA